MVKVGENALTKFLHFFIEWEKAIVDKLRTNRLMNCMSAEKRKEYVIAMQFYILCNALEDDIPK